ncbi:uncharacterized protein SOCEGT47_036130 [Sorangium cellulosum]|uniref:Uncharacterized protein n=1 Tax=Sorangium cellulosum TaxID=56 RepID=A0A4P2Q1J4_SORCE|nr:hypothetical protein [Sorangium cellulosum]AUX23094.1 uncharacterized protein SOCEGT47_036130 [Sorangium cellulosum]
MNERNLSRRLSTSIVDALKAHGHILVARGGANALARELEEKMSEDIAAIAPRLEPWALVDGEVTTTFGTDEIDDQVEELVATLTSTLMESEHVEDIFTEDNVIKRDVFRVMRDTLLGPRRGLGFEDDGPVHVRLDTLGYVASTVGKRAPAEVLREALTRAAQHAGGKLTGYDPELREATFSVESSDPDARLEIEEAVADELADLVEAKVVTLPMMERRVDYPRRIELGERGLRQRIDAAASRMLREGGCAASWELVGDRTLRLRLTPLSEQDALEVDSHMTAFTREIASLLGGSLNALGEAARPAAAPLRGEAPPPRHRGPESAPVAAAEDGEDEGVGEEDEEEATEEEAVAPSSKPAVLVRSRRPAEPAEEQAAVSKAKGQAVAPRSAKEPAAKELARKAAAAKEPARKAAAAEEPAAKEPARKAAAAEEPAVKEPARRAAAAKEPVAKEPARKAAAAKEPAAKEPARKAAAAKEPAAKEPARKAAAATAKVAASAAKKAAKAPASKAPSLPEKKAAKTPAKKAPATKR